MIFHINHLAPSSVLLELDVVLPIDQEMTTEDEEQGFGKRQKYVLKCKEVAWRKFHREYMAALRERHNLNHDDLVIIKGGNKNRRKWKLAIVEKLHSGKFNVIKTVRLKTAKTYLKRRIQLLYSMELRCNVRNTEIKLNPNMNEFRPS